MYNIYIYIPFYDVLTNPFFVLLDQTNDGSSHKTDRREEETTELSLLRQCCTSNNIVAACYFSTNSIDSE